MEDFELVWERDFDAETGHVTLTVERYEEDGVTKHLISEYGHATETDYVIAKGDAGLFPMGGPTLRPHHVEAVKVAVADREAFVTEREDA